MSGIPCLRLEADDMPWLVIEDTPFGRQEGLSLIFGDDLNGSPCETHFVDLNPVEKLIVTRCAYTRKELEELQEWEP